MMCSVFGCVSTTSMVGALVFQLDVPPISPKRLAVLAGYTTQPLEGRL
ncbi:MAG: hypothetical protein K6U75_13030 [Firmicutes bacterium]|nr:hypothetical protein [Bacillota bacterium]